MDEKYGLEEAWQILNRSLYSELNIYSQRPEDCQNPFRVLCFYLELDIYPPPEVLIALVDTYQSYLDQKGAIDLEEAFFGKPIKGRGNYSARQDKNEDIRMFDMLIKLEEFRPESESKRSQYSIAEEYLNKKGSTDDPESLLRKYRRIKNNSD